MPSGFKILNGKSPDRRPPFFGSLSIKVKPLCRLILLVGVCDSRLLNLVQISPENRFPHFCSSSLSNPLAVF